MKERGIQRRRLIVFCSSGFLAGLAGCASTENEDGSDVDSPQDGEENTTEDAEENQRESESNEEQLINVDPVTDLLPDVEDFPGDGWEVESVNLDPESRLRIDAEGNYVRNSGGGSQYAKILVTAYDSIGDAEERYGSSLSLAEAQNDLDGTIDESVDEGYIASFDEEAIIRVWRDRNVVFQVVTTDSSEPLPDLAEQLQTIVQDNWQKQFTD